jgi:hypothetical protein
MFKIHIGKTPCELGTQDFVHFGRLTEVRIGWGKEREIHIFVLNITA